MLKIYRTVESTLEYERRCGRFKTLVACSK